MPPEGNANYAWLQHVVSKLGPNGVAGVVLANGSMSTQQSGEGLIRQKMVEADLVKLQEFLLELGHGFCFEARQKRILIGDTHGFIDRARSEVGVAG